MRESCTCALDFFGANEIHKKFKHIKQAGGFFLIYYYYYYFNNLIF